MVCRDGALANRALSAVVTATVCPSVNFVLTRCKFIASCASCLVRVVVRPVPLERAVTPVVLGVIKLLFANFTFVPVRYHVVLQCACFVVLGYGQFAHGAQSLVLTVACGRCRRNSVRLLLSFVSAVFAVLIMVACVVVLICA